MAPSRAAVLALLLALPSRALGACTKDEMRLFTYSPDLTRQPFMTLARDPVITEACKRGLLGDLVSVIGFQVEGGLCPGQRCQDFETALKAVELVAESKTYPLCGKPVCMPGAACEACAVHAAYAATLAQADELVARSVYYEADQIVEKIRQGRVPSCFFPNGCPGDGCREALHRKWWQDAVMAQGDKERWVAVGSFSHLLLASAPSCAGYRQEGQTCGAQSASVAMSFYCTNPAYNPDAADSCTAEGPGFRCPGWKEVYEKAYDLGIGGATLCVEDPRARTSVCRAAIDNPGLEEQGEAYRAAAQACRGGGADCDERIRRLARLERRAGREYVRAQGRRDIRRAALGGNPELDWQRLPQVFKAFGFATRAYAPSSSGWSEALGMVGLGHPVQVAVDVKGWAGYDEGGHGVVLEGWWYDFKGGHMVLLRDSNDSTQVKAFPADVVRQSYLSKRLGGYAFCPPSDVARCSAP